MYKWKQEATSHLQVESRGYLTCERGTQLPMTHLPVEFSFRPQTKGYITSARGIQMSISHLHCEFSISPQRKSPHYICKRNSASHIKFARIIMLYTSNQEATLHLKMNSSSLISITSWIQVQTSKTRGHITIPSGIQVHISHLQVEFSFRPQNKQATSHIQE